MRPGRQKRSGASRDIALRRWCGGDSHLTMQGDTDAAASSGEVISQQEEVSRSEAPSVPPAPVPDIPGAGAGFGDGPPPSTRVDGTDATDRWMSYAELAQVRRTDKTSAIKIASRQRWRRRKNNQGTMQVLVPAKWALPYWQGTQPAASSETSAVPDESAAPTASSVQHALDGLNAAVIALRERAETADRRADVAEARAEAERLRAEQAQEGREAAEIRAERAQQAASEAQNRADRAEASRDQEQSKADALQIQVQETLTRLPVLEAEAKAAHDRAWASGEAQAGAERRAEAAQARADRAESAAASERQDFLDNENRTRQELEGVRREVEQARAQAHHAEETAASLRQADTERRLMGRWARLRAAWRGA